MANDVVGADLVGIHKFGNQIDKTLLRFFGKIPFSAVSVTFLDVFGIAHSALDADRVEVGTDAVEGVPAGSLQATATVPHDSSLRVGCFEDLPVPLDVVVASVSSSVQIRIVCVRHSQIVDDDEADRIGSTRARNL